MRATVTLLKKSRLPQIEKRVPFQEILPLKLKNQVSGKTDKGSDVACLQEMTVMFSCLKANEFDESLCSKEVTNFKRCYKVFIDTKATKKETSAKGTLVPGKDLNYKQLNKVLRQYPS
ncbi:coiled-coil-helix-coiled-coil-helix domain-containing protein 1 [Sabethes cyaneus]|uniref:coiled-coil-helix-coiled-coil-helix domain-containing protein 1 n=1 Tax=Sabethes cyaneus TaxID=53552 RepID=UPI00221E35B7|nr:coiled-coil-helix-coiled-coil-helix domain-containing protein 1 [Sabethes cyaneus]